MEEELNKRGWHLTPDGQDQCVENGDKISSVDSVIKKALTLDLRAIGKKWLPTDLSSGRITGDYVEGPAVLQIMKLRNISAPKDNEESQAAPRLWKITLTDGQANVAAVCLEPLKNLSLATPPGTKLLLEGRVDIKNGYLLLTNKNTRTLGGHVPNLVESWQLKRKLAQQSRLGVQSEGGPPPFVPFGKKGSKAEAPCRDDFKSLAASKETEEEEENKEFQQQRQATIAEAEALTAKPKTFGGGQKSSVKDTDLARIVEMGFTADQASSALRQCGGDVTEAIGRLLGGSVDSRGENYGQGRSRGGEGRGDAFRERGGRRDVPEAAERDGRRGGRRDRRRRGRGDEDDEEDSMSSRPSGPSTLFDFLENRIPSAAEKQNAVSKQRPPSSGQRQKDLGSQPANQVSATANDRPSSQRAFGQHTHTGEDWEKPSYQRREAREPYSASQVSDRGTKPSNRGPEDSRSGTQKSDSSGFDSGRNRARNPREDRRSQHSGGGGSEDDRQKQNQFSQQPNWPDHNNGSRTPAYSNRGDKQDENLQDRRSGRDSQRPKSHQSNAKPFREQTSQANGHPSDSRQEKPPSHARSNRLGHQGDDQRVETDSGQNANTNQKKKYGNQGPSQTRWRRGQVALAKYWEDNQLYRAVVEAVAENGLTAVVTFLDYGNQEEVLCTDIQPLQTHAKQNDGYPAAQGYGWDSRPFNMAVDHRTGFDSNYIPEMEFRRGGSRSAHGQQGQGYRR